MPTTFSHTNIVVRDPEALCAFYIDVFDCVQSGPPRDLHGPWLDEGMGLPGANVQGFHLRLPGQPEENGATLEIYSLDDLEPEGSHSVNRLGLMHIAFRVDDVEATLEKLLAAGGSRLGEIATAPVAGVGTARFVYARDPVGTIVELQEWQ